MIIEDQGEMDNEDESPDSTPAQNPGAGMRSQLGWQALADDACAEGYEAGSEYVRVCAEPEKRKAELAQERVVQFQASHRLGPQGVFMLPPVSQRVVGLERQCAELEGLKEKTRQRLLGAQQRLTALYEAAEAELYRSRKVTVFADSPLFFEHFDDANEGWNLEADFFGGLLRQIEEALHSLAQTIASADWIWRSHPDRVAEVETGPEAESLPREHDRHGETSPPRQKLPRNGLPVDLHPFPKGYEIINAPVARPLPTDLRSCEEREPPGKGPRAACRDTVAARQPNGRPVVSGEKRASGFVSFAETTRCAPPLYPAHTGPD